MTMFALLVFPTGTALAADVNIDCVTPGQDLQTAIDDAAGGDTIIIADASTCTGNFTVGKALTIRAATVAGATLDGNDVDDGAPVLTVTIGGDVTLQDLTITGGLNSAGDGGGIHVPAPSDLVDTTVTETAPLNGGGIWNDGVLNVTDSFVTNNTASVGGGGIHNISGGDVTVTNSEITANDAEHAGRRSEQRSWSTQSKHRAVHGIADLRRTPPTGAIPGEPAGGGGIYNFSTVDVNQAQLTLTNTEVSGNTSTEGAAGIRNADATAALNGATITGNNATGDGGGIRTSGITTVTDSDVSENTSTTSGGGISLDGLASTLTITGSTVNLNDATSQGGGISVAVGNTATVEQSSVTRNTAGAGAGFSNSGTLNVTNSTVSANVSVTQGGGILTSGDLTVTHATIATNNAGVAGEGGGVRVIGTPAVTLTGTILWGNLGNSGQDCSGPLASGGYNLVGAKAAPCDYTGDLTDAPPLSDPMLGALEGVAPDTDHHPLLAGSDAIDAAGACGLAEDQIAATRPDGPACDIGAIEATSPVPPVVADEVVLVEPNGRWHIRVPGNDDYTFFYGIPGDVPLFGDWDGDGFDTPGMYRPTNGFAYLTNTLPADDGVGVAEFDFFYGIPGDQVFVGDWDGINGDSLGISRNGKIYLANTNATVFADIEFWFGLPTDIAYGADPDGDGKDTVIVYRESTSFAYYTNDTTMEVAPTDGDLFFGIPGDSFVIGDWDADLVDTPGVFRGSDTTVYLKNDYVTGVADDSYVWGTDGWTPVAGVHGVMPPPA